MPKEQTMQEKKESVKPTTKQPSVVWNDSNMKTTYANATNVVAGREEVVMLLGMNHNWQMAQDEVKIDLLEKVVLSPYTAKRLAIMLHATLKAYEAKYGTIDIGLPAQPAKSK